MALGEALEILAAHIHKSHDRGRKFFIEDEGRAHRERRDDVETDIASAQARGASMTIKIHAGKSSLAPPERSR
jgi:hypothetical protein